VSEELTNLPDSLPLYAVSRLCKPFYILYTQTPKTPGFFAFPRMIPLNTLFVASFLSETIIRAEASNPHDCKKGQSHTYVLG